jgi:predicted MFS family arabinose efflux permease
MITVKESMSPIERRATFSIAAIFSTRMLGLFMIFPVFVLFAQEEFANVTGTQIGIAMGIYGLTQALLQIPYGVLSDKYGRKPLVIIGMLVFMFGSIVCAMADSIELMIVGRTIQGMGAVAAVLMATVADLVEEKFRLRAMAVVGITIGLSFTASLALGPFLSSLFGVRGIFWITALIALAGVLLVIYAVPEIKNQSFQREAQADSSQFAEVLKNTELLRLDIGVFILHAMLTAMFIAVPLMMRDEAGLDVLHHWHIYLPVMLLSFLLMVPFIIMAESKGKMKQIFVGAILTISLMQFAFVLLPHGYWWLAIVLLVFFTAFNLLEASLPSLVVKTSPADKKGTASGVYSSSQFMGAAVGGLVGGISYQYYGIEGVFYFTGIIGLIWFIVASYMKNPLPLSIATVALNSAMTTQEIASLTKKMLEDDGIHEVVFKLEESRVFFKIDRQFINEVGLAEYFR